MPLLHPNARLGFMLGACLIAGTSIAHAKVEDRIEKSFQVRGGGKLVMTIDRGSIHVKSGENDRVQVEVIRAVKSLTRGRAEDLFKNHKVEITQRGDDVHIHSEFPEGWGGWFKSRQGNLSVEYRILVPRQYQVDVKTSGGRISVQDLEGQVDAKTSGGSLEFAKIRGPIFARTSGGSIHIAEIDGAVKVHTSGGSIKINEVQGDVVAETSGGSISVTEILGRLQASTSGGSVSAHLRRQPEGDCSLKTSGGSIDVKLAETIAVDLDAKTSGGRVITDFPVTIQGELKRNALRSKLNGGGPALVLETSGGNVRIGKL